VEQPSGQERLVWSFWLAAGLAAVGGVLPLVFGGTSSRMATVIVPFAIGAIALALCGFLHNQGRAVRAIVYFVAGLAIVYGILAMFSIPLELAVLGTCPAPPAPCTGGLGRPLTVGENTGMGFAAGFGLLALFSGFFGLMVVFRKPLLPAAPPPVRHVPAVEAPNQAQAEAATESSPNGAAPVVDDEEPELPAHEEEERPELPPHESSSPTT
jgi:hypothetical protein